MFVQIAALKWSIILYRNELVNIESNIVSASRELWRPLVIFGLIRFAANPASRFLKLAHDNA